MTLSDLKMNGDAIIMNIALLKMLKEFLLEVECMRYLLWTMALWYLVLSLCFFYVSQVFCFFTSMARFFFFFSEKISIYAKHFVALFCSMCVKIKCEKLLLFVQNIIKCTCHNHFQIFYSSFEMLIRKHWQNSLL